MGTGKHRNQECWCGSGKKYKHCHLARQLAPPPSLEETLSALKRNQKLRHCLHPLAGADTCRGNIVQAHTVPRSSLATIARKGQVYRFDSDLPTMLRTRGTIAERLVGISKASTFTGFCEHHDNQLFAPLEKVNFAPTQETAFLLTFRAVAREIHDKILNTGIYERWLEYDRGRSLEQQQLVHEKALLFQIGTRAALNDLYKIKERLDADWGNSDFSKSFFVAIELASPPSVMCSGATTPQEDFDGNELQDMGDLLAASQSVAFTSFSDGAAGWLVFSWAGESSVAERLVASLARQPENLLPHFLLRYIFEFLSNTYMAPPWWEGLTERQQIQLRQRMQAGADPRHQDRTGLLLDDGLRVVDWQLKNVVQHLPDTVHRPSTVRL